MYHTAVYRARMVMELHNIPMELDDLFMDLEHTIQYNTHERECSKPNPIFYPTTLYRADFYSIIIIKINKKRTCRRCQIDYICMFQHIFVYGQECMFWHMRVVIVDI